MNSPMYFI